MSGILFKVIQKKDPRDPEAAGKYYGRIVSIKQIDIKELSERIAARVTCQRADIEGVLAAIQPLFRQNILNGKIVSLSQIGRWRASLNGVGANTKEEYDTTYLTKIKTVFVPNRSIKERLLLTNSEVKLIRIQSTQENTGEEEEGQ